MIFSFSKEGDCSATINTALVAGMESMTHFKVPLPNTYGRKLISAVASCWSVVSTTRGHLHFH